MDILASQQQQQHHSAVAEFDAAVAEFGSEDLIWALQGKVTSDKLETRYSTPHWCSSFTLPDEGWHALERVMLADTVIRIGRFQPELVPEKPDSYDCDLDNLADWLKNTRWALEVMDRRHQQDGVMRVRDFEEWIRIATIGTYTLRNNETPGWGPHLETYIRFVVALLRMQITPISSRSMKPSEVRAAFDRFLEIAEATTVTVTAKALPESQEAIAERLNRLASG